MSSKNNQIRKFIAQEEQRKNPCSDDIRFGDISTLATTEYEIKDSQVSANSDGSFFAIWKLLKTTTLGLVGQYFNSTNAPIGNQINITTFPFIGTIGAKTFSANKDVLVSWSTLATSASNWKIHFRYYKYYEHNNIFVEKYEEILLESIKDRDGRDSKGKYSLVPYQDDIVVSNFPSSQRIDNIRYQISENGLTQVRNISEYFCSRGMNKITSTVSPNGTLAVAWSAKKNIHVQHYNLFDGTSLGSRIEIPAIPETLFIDKTNATTVVGWQSGKLSECQGLLQNNLLYYTQVFNNNGQSLSNIVNISVSEFETLNQLHQITNTAFGATFTVGSTKEHFAIQRVFLNNGTLITSKNTVIRPTNTTETSTTAKHKFAVQSVDPITQFLAYTAVLAIARGTQYVLYEMESTTAQAISHLDNTIDHDNNQCTLTCDERLQNIKDTLGSDVDPIVIDRAVTNAIRVYLDWCNNLELSYDNRINIDAGFEWQKNDLTIKSKHNITVGDGVIISNLGKGTLKLMAGIESNDHNATVNFADNARIYSPNAGTVNIYYNPRQDNKQCKYHNSIDYNYYTTDIISSYMWVHDFDDLENIQYFLHGYFALASDIVASDRKFIPLTRITNFNKELVPFSGIFDGMGNKIIGLEIHYPTKNNVGMFSFCAGTENSPVTIHNLILESPIVTGHNRVGSLCGKVQYAKIYNITINNAKIVSDGISAGLLGSAILSDITNININLNTLTSNVPYFAGASMESKYRISSEYKEVTIIGQDLEANEVLYV